MLTARLAFLPLVVFFLPPPVAASRPPPPKRKQLNDEIEEADATNIDPRC